ncbi:MAG: hypothetical protein KatS3mg076_0012 [Candidatus Binatia bacterium]|nr:MAG: hypothetical protein KatS3mg076_0012 [Candidatus Binatia bacterium]
MGKAESTEGILVLGPPRSGTTLLRRLLDAHPRIACPPETNVFAACGRFLRSEKTADGVGIGVLEGLEYAGFSREDVLSRLRELAFSFHREYASRQGKARWAAKTAFDAFYLPEIEALCGDRCAYVCLERHGLDVACSIQELCEKNGAYLRELHDYVVRYPAVLEAFAHAWADLARGIRAFAASHPEHSFLLRYEDLVAEPDATMQKLMGFLGESWDPEFTSKALSSRETVGLGDWKTYGRSSIDASSVGRWKKLPRYTLARLAEICNPVLELCGYEPVRVEPEEPPEAARRRYQVGLLLQRLKGAGRKDREPGPEPAPEE